MKLYGSRRYDTLACDYGCCGCSFRRAAKQTAQAKACRKAAKKRARREARNVISDES